MITKQQAYANALQTVRDKRHRALEQADALRHRLLNTSSSFHAIEQELIHLSHQKMQAKIRNDGTFADLQNQYTATQLKREVILTELGYTSKSLSPAFACGICADTGLGENGYCDCVKTLAHQAMLKDLCENIPTDSYRFDTFSLDYYTNPTEKEQMKNNFERCKRYAENFSKQSESMYLLGNTGLGKTHLTFSIAKEVVGKGYSVLYSSAPNMITMLEKEHFGHLDYDVSDYYLNCDLLIIDDLGTEFISTVTQAALYNVIDHRCLMKLPTIINSNLTPVELEQRYGKRLLSRIIGCYATLSFVGKDIRIQKRMISKKV